MKGIFHCALEKTQAEEWQMSFLPFQRHYVPPSWQYHGRRPPGIKEIWQTLIPFTSTRNLLSLTCISHDWHKNTLIYCVLVFLKHILTGVVCLRHYLQSQNVTYLYPITIAMFFIVDLTKTCGSVSRNFFFPQKMFLWGMQRYYLVFPTFSATAFSLWFFFFSSQLFASSDFPWGRA